MTDTTKIVRRGMPWRLKLERFVLNLGIFIPKQNGVYFLSSFSAEKQIGIFGSLNSERIKLGYWLGDNLFSLVSTKPSINYLKLIDRYVPHGKGTYKIVGAYPFYRASDGNAVFLDIRRCFSLAPVDFPGRVQEYFSQRTVAAKNRRISKKQAYVHKGRFTYRITDDPNSTSYVWKVRFRGEDIVKGKAETRVHAERAAERAIREQRVAMFKNVR